MEVHKKLGSEFLESVYSKALEMEFKKTEIPYEKEKKLPVYYEDIILKKYFRADYVCMNQLFWNLKLQSIQLMLIGNKH